MEQRITKEMIDDYIKIKIKEYIPDYGKGKRFLTMKKLYYQVQIDLLFRGINQTIEDIEQVYLECIIIPFTAKMGKKLEIQEAIRVERQRSKAVIDKLKMRLNEIDKHLGD